MNELKNKEALKETLEKVRAEKYSELPSEVVAQIVEIQSQDRENTTKTAKAIRDVILNYLSNN